MGEGFVIYLSTWTHRNSYYCVTVHTPRGIVDMNSNQKHPGNWNSALQYLV